MENSECNRSYSVAVAMSAKEVDYASALRQVRSEGAVKSRGCARLSPAGMRIAYTRRGW